MKKYLLIQYARLQSLRHINDLLGTDNLGLSSRLDGAAAVLYEARAARVLNDLRAAAALAQAAAAILHRAEDCVLERIQ